MVSNDQQCDIRLVEIAGCIASGKTSLAKALAGESVTNVYEDYEKNPFWKAFFVDPSSYAFEAEITFLLQHYHDVKRAVRQTSGTVLMDYSFELDMAYAELGLKGSKKGIFSQIYNEIREEIGFPRALVYVSCRAEELFRRMLNRGRAVEESITVEFLSELQNQLDRRIEEIADTVTVIRIDSEMVDIRKDGRWRERLVERCITLRSDLEIC